MRDSNHGDFIDRWIKFMKSNQDWKRIHTKFINAQFEKAYSVIEELSKTKEGQKKIVKMYNIKNLKAFPKLLKDLQ